MQLNRISTFKLRGARLAIILLVGTALAGCYAPQAVRDYDRDGTVPWWCQGTPNLTKQECVTFSWQLDLSVARAASYPMLADALAAGATSITNVPGGIGHAVTLPGAPGVFDAEFPNVLLYTGTDPVSRIAGVAWRFFGTEPTGFPGNRDIWQFEGVSGAWWLSAWIVRGYQNHPDVFAATHPCLAANIVPTSTTEPCFMQAHTEPLEILVSNDDGYSADGIAVMVDALYTLPNVDIQVVAPFLNQSGSGSQTTQPPFTTSAVTGVFTSGTPPKPATYITSSDTSAPRNGSGSPADSVIYALDVMLLSPELIISGMNEGQNMVEPIVNVSGTVGAARTGAMLGLAAIATSQGSTAEPDFPTGAAATLALLEEWRLGHRPTRPNNVWNINTPTCEEGTSVRGTLNTVVATGIDGRSYSEQDCASTETEINDDLDAFNHGFIGITDVGR